MKTHLEDKFLITGADSLSPRPCLPHATFEDAMTSAEGLVRGASFTQSGAIIWKAHAVVAVKKPELPPIEVRLMPGETAIPHTSGN